MIRIPILRNPAPGSPAEELLHHMLAVNTRVESDLLSKPAMDFSETESEFHAYIALPGVDARSIRVAAVPDAIIIQAECCRPSIGKLRIGELPCQTFYRKIALDEPIRLEGVTAVLDHGLLHMTACKGSARRPTMAATA